MTGVLIVDDDQTTLASLLSGYEAMVCDNAVGAITLLRTERFVMVLSEVVDSAAGQSAASQHQFRGRSQQQVASTRGIGASFTTGSPCIWRRGQSKVDVGIQ